MSGCRHQFFRKRPISRRWVCIHCLFETSHYDGADRLAGRPIHPHMSVAYRGFNTISRANMKKVKRFLTTQEDKDQ